MYFLEPYGKCKRTVLTNATISSCIQLIQIYPMFHVGGYVGIHLLSLSDSTTLILVPRPEPSAAVNIFCRERLAAYKVPKQIEFIAELPKSMVKKDPAAGIA